MLFKIVELFSESNFFGSQTVYIMLRDTEMWFLISYLKKNLVSDVPLAQIEYSMQCINSLN